MTTAPRPRVVAVIGAGACDAATAARAEETPEEAVRLVLEGPTSGRSR